MKINSTLRKGLLVTFAVLLVGGMAVVPAAASNSVINYDSSAAPQPAISGDVTIDHHRMGDSALTYNNDNGDWQTFKGSVNSSVDNPYEFVATDVAFQDAGAFPHSKENYSALTGSEWSISGQNSSKLSTSDVETAPGVNALAVTTDGSMASGDTATASFSNFSITSEENKRYLQTALDINTLDSGTTVELRVVDADGDYKTAEINTSRTSGEDFIGNSTGEGHLYQRQLGKMDLTANGDGTFNDIESVEVVVSGGDFDGEFSALNLDKLSTWDFGDRLVNTDSDDELETQQILEHKTGGALAVSDLSTLGDTFSNADIKGLTVPFILEAQDLDSENVETNFTSADQYANYDSHFKGYTRFSLPSAYDLSYANLALTDTVSVPGSRYVNVQYAEGTGDTAFSDISSWSDITGSYSSVGASVTIDDTIQPGTSLVVSYDYVVTSEEKTSLQNSGPVGPVDAGGSQDIIDWLVGIPGAIIVAAGGIFGRVKSWW